MRFCFRKQYWNRVTEGMVQVHGSPIKRDKDKFRLWCWVVGGGWHQYQKAVQRECQSGSPNGNTASNCYIGRGHIPHSSILHSLYLSTLSSILILYISFCQSDNIEYRNCLLFVITRQNQFNLENHFRHVLQHTLSVFL